MFLATNRPHDLDEAMHRRITAVLEYRYSTLHYTTLLTHQRQPVVKLFISLFIFLTSPFSSLLFPFHHFTSSSSLVPSRPPDHVMRRAIWSNLLYGSGKAVTVADDKLLPLTLPSTSHTDTNSIGSGNGNGNVISGDSSNSNNSNSDHHDLNGNGSGSESKNGISKELVVEISSALANNSNSNSSSSDSVSGLQLSSDVDIAALASKYELTGGFIKNAVLSALLSAISRSTDKKSPVLTQVQSN